MGITVPDILYIDARVRGLPATQRILSRLPNVHSELILDLKSLYADSDFVKAKRQWLLTQSGKRWYRQIHQQGETVLMNADFVLNTPYDCSYSPLPIVIARAPFLTIVVNVEEALADLARRCASDPQRHFVVRCGELGDALALDHITHYSEALIPFFTYTANASLELWTRTDNIALIREISHGGRTTVIFAVTPQSIIDREEHGTAALKARLQAAKELAQCGFKIAFSIDPVIHYNGWKQDYDALIDQLWQVVPTCSQIYLSCFHYPRGLADRAIERFPGSKIFFGELVPVNGCYRYFRPIRQKMYEYLISSIRLRSPQIPLKIVGEHGLMSTIAPTLVNPAPTHTG